MILENPQINYLDIPQAQIQEFIPHPLRFRNRQLISGSIILLLLLAVPVILLLHDNLWFGWSLFALWVILVVLRTTAVFKSFSIRGYALRQHDISYRKGWIFFSVLTIPFNRIQHSEISQGPLDRIFELKNLKIYTAGGSGADLVIPGLTIEGASKLRDFVANKASQHE